MTSRDISRDPISLDFFKKSRYRDLTIFNTKVLKIYDFRFPEKSKITERITEMLFLEPLRFRFRRNLIEDWCNLRDQWVTQMSWDFTIFNTKVLKIIHFRFLDFY
jgi:hypothetical protein